MNKYPMRINIAYNTVNPEYLYEQASMFEEREATMPYLIMSTLTFNALTKVAADHMIICDNGMCEYRDYRLLINEDLRFGEVDIR